MKNKLLKFGLLSTALLLAACGTTDEGDTDPVEDDAVETPEEAPEETPEDDETAEEPAESTGLSLKLAYGAPHGNQSFSATFVVMDGDTVVDVIIDEFQFMEGDDWDGVPNDDEAFGDGYGEELTLVSKRENNEDYSAMMTDIAGSTISYNDNMDAVQAFAIGKTIAEIEEAISELDGLGEDDEIADVVSGATFADTSGYLQTVVDTANDGYEFPVAEDVDLNAVELSYSLEAPHGDRAFALVAVLHDADTVYGAAMDELQFLSPADFEGVPNSDAAFGENYAEDVVLASKMFNDEAYSANMANAGATLNYSENMLTIIDFAIGSTFAELDEVEEQLDELGEEDPIADVVTGATFVDTKGYIDAITETVDN